ncbi:MAG: hypothetical protein IPK88_10800 [Saprospiraceae bacterium]|nr:hypothetical protein [Candidatus Defluviibacterium haderslevense]
MAYDQIFNNYQSKKGVSWFSASILIQTLIDLYTSSKANDHREEDAPYEALYLDHLEDNYEDGSFWMDYISDTGDGFNETLSVLYKCLQDQKIQSHELRKGNIVFFGGDEVYPVASSENYANKLFGPLMTAQGLHKVTKTKNDTSDSKSSCAEDREHYIHAIPGNHDWYDGLFAFKEYFCTNRQYGSYFTGQSRSYGAIRLTKNVWLWMLDIQLAGNFNKDQIEYFKNFCNTKKTFNKHNNEEEWNVILGIAQPYWFQKSVDKEDKLFTVVDHFISELFINNNPYLVNIEKPGKKGTKIKYKLKRFIKLKLILTGDIHHYTRFNLKLNEKLNTYGSEKKFQATKNPPIDPHLNLITSGGGGAYSYPTHYLEDKVNNRAFQSKINNQSIHLVNYYPKAYESHQEMPTASYSIITENFSFILFPLLMNMLCWLLFYNYIPLFINVPVVLKINHFPLMLGFHVLGYYGFSYLLANALDKYFHYIPTYHKFSWNIMVILFALINMGIFLLGGYFQNAFISTFKYPINDLLIQFKIGILFSIIVFSCALINTILFGLYLYLCNSLFRLHDNEVFSISKVNKFKNYLKIKIDKDNITVFPIGIDHINNSLQKSFDNKIYDKLHKDLDQTKTKMIEEPIVISLR